MKIGSDDICVHYDKDSPYSGVKYPIGTETHPVNNLQDAAKIFMILGLVDDARKIQKKLRKLKLDEIESR